MTALLNGHAAGEWAFSRGLQYGDGVFRTILAINGEMLDWSLHLDKLNADCRALGLDMPASETLLSEARLLVNDHARAVLKLLVVRCAGGRGYRAESNSSDRVLLRFVPPKFPSSHWTEGINAFRSPFALSTQPALAGIKHLNRLEQVLASQNWPVAADEGIVCDQVGGPIGGTRSNLFCVRNEQLHTPTLTNCGIAGIMRAKIIAMAASLDIRTHQAPLTWEALVSADEVFVCNALIGIWPVRTLEGRSWSAPGVITSALMAALRHPMLN